MQENIRRKLFSIESGDEEIKGTKGKCLFKVTNRDIRVTCIDVALVSLLLILSRNFSTGKLAFASRPLPLLLHSLWYLRELKNSSLVLCFTLPFHTLHTSKNMHTYTKKTKMFLIQPVIKVAVVQFKNQVGPILLSLMDLRLDIHIGTIFWKTS